MIDYPQMIFRAILRQISGLFGHFFGHDVISYSSFMRKSRFYARACMYMRVQIRKPYI